jgi:hypothetical protein
MPHITSSVSPTWPTSYNASQIKPPTLSALTEITSVRSFLDPEQPLTYDT